MGKKDYSTYTKEELIKEVESLKKQKTYGLVWEEDKTKENFDYYINWEGIKNKEIFKDAEKKFPVLKEVKSKEIKTNKNENYNILIEGDNYHSLAVLNFTHKKAIDVICIDPPYNTGKEFIYNDKLVDSEDQFRHSKWLSFMSKRLKLAKNLLSKKGVIFIFIDDHEQAGLKLLCDEIFGEKNFVANFVWKKTENIKMDSKFISINKDYVLCYRDPHLKKFNKQESDIARFKLEDKKGKYYLRKLDSKSSTYSKSMDYIIEHDGAKYYAGGSYEKYKKRQIEGGNKKDAIWLWSKETYEKGLKDGEIVFKNKNVYNKVRYDGIAKKPYIDILDFVSVQTAQKELDKLFGNRVFDHPKPTSLIKTLLEMTTNPDSIILDFFAGSGTTGQATLQLNEFDSGKRKFILCTNDENKICSEVCYPRINKVLSKENLKYYKTDFVDSKGTDKNKRKLVSESTDMLCIKESAFEKVVDKTEFKIFKNDKSYLGIVFDEDSISDFVKEVKKINGKFNVYVFSLDASVPEDEFEEVKDKVSLCPIPEVILHVYRRVFKND